MSLLPPNYILIKDTANAKAGDRFVYKDRYGAWFKNADPQSARFFQKDVEDRDWFVPDSEHPVNLNSKDQWATDQDVMQFAMMRDFRHSVLQNFKRMKLSNRVLFDQGK